MVKKKRQSNVIGWAILGLMALGIYQFGISSGGPGSGRLAVASTPARPAVAKPARAVASPLSTPRIVSVASLNVRHTPSISGPLITTLPRGTALRVLDRQDGWLLVDLSPTLEGWVSEDLTTTRITQPQFVPPLGLKSSQ